MRYKSHIVKGYELKKAIRDDGVINLLTKMYTLEDIPKNFLQLRIRVKRELNEYNSQIISLEQRKYSVKVFFFDKKTDITTIITSWRTKYSDECIDTVYLSSLDIEKIQQAICDAQLNRVAV